MALGSEQLRFVHTPGHTADSMVVVYGENLFTGDTLFADEDCGKLGRTEWLRTMFESLRKFDDMPDASIVYSGHRYGRKDHTTLGFEKRHNPALLCRSLDDFRRLKRL